jgi:hypothetical protein
MEQGAQTGDLRRYIDGKWQDLNRRIRIDFAQKFIDGELTTGASFSEQYSDLE